MTENILNPKLPLLNLDVQKQQEWAAPAQLMTQGDKGYIQPFTLSQNWEKYQVDTTSLGLRFSKPDGNIYDSGVTTSGIVTETGLTSAGFKTYEIELPKELTQVPGTVTAYIYAANSAGTIVASSNRFTYQVLPEFSADPSSTTYIKGLDEIRDQLDGYLDKIKTLSDSYGADKDAIVANMKKQAQQWLTQEQDELSNQLTAEQQKLSDLSQKYTDKYNQLISQLPDADDAITQKINKALADIQKQAQDALKGVDLSKYELKSDLAVKLDTINKALEKAISIDDVNRALASYATKADLDKKADKSELSNYATKDELKAIQPGTPDLSGYETKSDHANDINGIRDALEHKANSSDLATLETKADAKKALDTKANTADLATYATKTDLSAKADKTALAGYATKTDLDAKANTADLVAYETKADAKKALDAKANVADLATYATKDELKAIQPGAPDLSGYETTTAHKKDIDDINNALKGKADVASLSDLATKADLDEKANKTDIPDTSQFATKTDLDTKADKTVLAGYATKTDLDTKANVSDLATYETKADAKKALDAKANVADLATYATKDELKTIKPGAPDLSGYETTTAHKKDIDDINNALKGKASVAVMSEVLSHLATKTDLDAKANTADLATYATKEDLKAKADTTALAGYETKADAKKALDAKANTSDLATYATKEDLNAKADTTALAGYATKDDLKTIQPAAPDLSNYETTTAHKKDIDDINNALKGKADVASLSDLATKADLDEKANKTDIPDTSQFATKTDLNTKADKTVLAGYATKTDLDTKADKTALDAKANTSDLTAYETKADAKKSLDAKANASDLATYATKEDLNTKADATALAGYATKTDLDAKANASDLATYETKADAKKALDAKVNTSDMADYATKTDLDTKADKTALADYETKADAKKALDAKANAADLATYATKEDLNTKADTTALAGYATKDDLKNVKPAETDLSSYEKTADHKKDIDDINKALSNKADKTDIITPNFPVADLIKANQILHDNVIKADELNTYRHKFTSYKGNNPYTTLGIGPGTIIYTNTNGFANYYMVIGINSLNQKIEPMSKPTVKTIATAKNWLILINCMPLSYKDAPSDDMYDYDKLRAAMGSMDTQLKAEFGDYYINSYLYYKTAGSNGTVPALTISNLLNQYMIWGEPLIDYQSFNKADSATKIFFEPIEIRQQPLFKLYPHVLSNFVDNWPNLDPYGGHGFYLDDLSDDGSNIFYAQNIVPGCLTPGVDLRTDFNNRVKRSLLIYFAITIDDLSIQSESHIVSKPIEPDDPDLS